MQSINGKKCSKNKAKLRNLSETLIYIILRYGDLILCVYLKADWMHENIAERTLGLFEMVNMNLILWRSARISRASTEHTHTHSIETP